MPSKFQTALNNPVRAGEVELPAGQSMHTAIALDGLTSPTAGPAPLKDIALAGSSDDTPQSNVTMIDLCILVGNRFWCSERKTSVNFTGLSTNAQGEWKSFILTDPFAWSKVAAALAGESFAAYQRCDSRLAIADAIPQSSDSSYPADSRAYRVVENYYVNGEVAGLRFVMKREIIQHPLKPYMPLRLGSFSVRLFDELVSTLGPAGVLKPTTLARTCGFQQVGTPSSLIGSKHSTALLARDPVWHDFKSHAKRRRRR